MIAFGVFLVLAIVMAVLDSHPVTAGTSQTLLAKASYPKVYVHFVGGLALAALLDPFIVDDFWLVAAVLVIGGVYEAVQWLNIRGEKRKGVFTLAEAIAVAAGALVLVVVKYVPVWF
jgi:hypothetical protein